MSTHDEPMTPEQRYDAELANLGDWSAGECIVALRDMIASLDAELARLTETVNTQLRLINRIVRNDLTQTDKRITALESHECVPDLGPLQPFIPPEPDTVAVPRSLMDALDIAIERAAGTNGYTLNGSAAWKQLAERYDAWKAGQG